MGGGLPVLVVVVTLLTAWPAPSLAGQEIQAAVLPLPEALRASATVVRLDPSMHPQVLRQGTNGMVCIADRLEDDQFDVRCYHDSFIPVVYRAFQLGYGVSGKRVGDEIAAGTLHLAPEPTAGYRCLGPIAGYDAARGTQSAEIECWESIHFPFRTAAQVGLPEEADVPESRQRGTPYVMAGGTYWSHVMLRHPPPR